MSTDQTISLPDSWRNKQHRSSLMYFIPDWDDLVDPDYDFETDTHSGGVGNWSNQVYAHQLYTEPNYDGILISKGIAEQSKKKRELIYQHGVHRYLRVPREFPIMGDCGAFSYVAEKKPPYSTSEIVEYYTLLGFDYGVSIDHLLFGASTPQEQKERYDLTIHNAEEFLLEHNRQKCTWTPIGALQGWDTRSFAGAARQYVDMGYDYLGLGGLVRSTNKEILAIAQAVQEVIPRGMKMHLFGVARPEALTAFVRSGISSVDSASPLRQAWMREKEGYLTETGPYAAIRVPDMRQSSRARGQLRAKGFDEAAALRLEMNALNALRGYALHKSSLESCLEAVLEYEQVVSSDDKNLGEVYRRTLADRPWDQCDCPICKRHGIEVVIFRGNNRNRRRGFHNTYVFYRVMQRILAGEEVHHSWVEKNGAPYQLPLPIAPESQEL